MQVGPTLVTKEGKLTRYNIERLFSDSDRHREWLPDGLKGMHDRNMESLLRHHVLPDLCGPFGRMME